MVAPLVSVVVPVHNGAHWLLETLDSLFAQTMTNFEVVLVDDASTDSLQEVVKEYPDECLRVLHLASNVGVSAARNHGIHHAQGEFIAFCDADDVCLPERLEKQTSFMRANPDIDFCGSSFQCFDTQDHEVVTNPQTDAQIRKALMRGNCFGLSTVMVKTSVLKQYGFDVSRSFAEDYDLWTRLVSSGFRAGNLPEILVRYRLHPHQASNKKSEELDHASRKIRTLYCARLLGDLKWVQQISVGIMSAQDLDYAAQKVQQFVGADSSYSARDFRFMLAWLYQMSPSHNMAALWRWWQLQKKLQLNLDFNYRLNTLLLAVIPKAWKLRHFETLIKLKR